LPRAIFIEIDICEQDVLPIDSQSASPRLDRVRARLPAAVAQDRRHPPGYVYRASSRVG
jgi:hypothetical protein